MPTITNRFLCQSEMKNYLSASDLLVLFQRCWKKPVLSLLSSYYNSSNFCNTFHSAYRPGNSTKTTLLKVVDGLLLSLDKISMSMLTLLDFYSAFVTTDQSIIACHLHTEFGFTDNVLQWFSSYLTNYTQYVSIYCSALASTYSGVPQS